MTYLFLFTASFSATSNPGIERCHMQIALEGIQYYTYRVLQMSIVTPPSEKRSLVVVVGVPARSVVVLVVILVVLVVFLSILAALSVFAALVIVTVFLPHLDVDNLHEQLTYELVIGFIFRVDYQDTVR